jgi:hypothetical protein
MMDLLPPVGWGDIATKRNVQAEVGVVRSENGPIERHCPIRPPRGIGQAVAGRWAVDVSATCFVQVGVPVKEPQPANRTQVQVARHR